MSLLVLFSQILVLYAFMRIEKTKQKQNFLSQLALGIVLLFCYNLIISYAMSYLHIPIGIFSYSLVNVIISVALLYYSKKQNSQQLYSYSKMDIIAVVILICVGFYTCYKNMQGGFNLGYETTDPSVHFYASKIFALTDSIFNNMEVPYYGKVGGLSSFYCNCGYFMRGLSSFFDVSEYYKLFQIFDGFIFILAGIIFYATTSHFFKKDKYKFVGIVISVFYYLGYPLNAYLFGFGYLPVTIIIINSVIYLLDMAKISLFDQLNRKIIYMIELFLCFFGIFFGYYFFVPVVYSASFLYIAYLFWNKKVLFKKNNILFLFVVLILPSILGFAYFVLPAIISRGETTVEAIALEGYIYRNLYQNFLILIPFFLYGIHLSIKERTAYSIITIFSILFTVAVFVLGIYNKASSYYFYKMYYMLWLLGFYSITWILGEILETNFKPFALYSLTSFIAVFSLFWIGFDDKVRNKNILFNPSPTLGVYFDVYNMNRTYCRGHFLNEDQIKLISEVDSIATEKGIDQVIMKGETLQRLWALSMTDLYLTDDRMQLGSFYEECLTIKEFVESKYKIYFSFGNINDENIDKVDLTGYDIIAKDSGYILVKK